VRRDQYRQKKGRFEMIHLYSIATWDINEQGYTPQAGLTVPSQNVPWRTMLEVLRQLRNMGYTAHRRRDPNGEHEDNDWCVLVERTDGEPLKGER
jgi:hypothetical protein